MKVCIECPVGGLIPWFDSLQKFKQEYIHTYNNTTYVVAEYSGDIEYQNPVDVNIIEQDYAVSTMTLLLSDVVECNVATQIGISYGKIGEYTLVVDGLMELPFSLKSTSANLTVTFPQQGKYLIYVKSNLNGEELCSMPVSVAKTKETRITLYSFRSRFTIEEKAAIEMSAVDDPLVRAVLKDFDSATYIDLSRSDVQQGVDIFVQKNLLTEPRAREILTPERAVEILSSEVDSSEIPWFFQQ